MIAQGSTDAAIPHTHALPYPTQAREIRPVQRRNTSPFAAQPRLDDPARFAAQEKAAETLAALDKRARKARTPKARNAAQPRAPKAPRTRTNRGSINVQRIVDLYKSGLTIRQIHEQTGHATSAIRYKLNDAGCATRTRQGGVEKVVDVKRMTALYLAGATVAQVAADVGLGVETARRRLKAAGVTLRDDRGRNGQNRKTA